MQMNTSIMGKIKKQMLKSNLLAEHEESNEDEEDDRLFKEWDEETREGMLKLFEIIWLVDRIIQKII